VVPEFCYAHFFLSFSSVSANIPEWQLKSRDHRFDSDVFKCGFEESVWAFGEGDNKAGDPSPYMSIY
jgi:hypothetical protein